VRRVSALTDRIAVVGAGASTLVGDLVGEGYEHIEAIDISEAALAQLRDRLGKCGSSVATRACDVRDLTFTEPVDVWHDRAVFHFLTDVEDQAVYATRAADAVRPGGHLLIATFAVDGPEQCSGLPVQRHDAASLAAAFGANFELVESFDDVHVTPWGAEQSFVHVTFRREFRDCFVAHR
jgi:2-polyprenyl-3-methyl-5-hydroxy-6-metoxy-1,4-benzoquinol methylase